MTDFQREIDAINAACGRLALDEEQRDIDAAMASSLVEDTVESAMAKAVVANLPLAKVKLMYPMLAHLTLAEFRSARIMYMSAQRALNM